MIQTYCWNMSSIPQKALTWSFWQHKTWKIHLLFNQGGMNIVCWPHPGDKFYSFIALIILLGQYLAWSKTHSSDWAPKNTSSTKPHAWKIYFKCSAVFCASLIRHCSLDFTFYIYVFLSLGSLYLFIFYHYLFFFFFHIASYFESFMKWDGIWLKGHCCVIDR